MNKIWDKIAVLYEKKFMDFDLYNDTYDFFNEQLDAKNSSVLEIACGPGNITQYLLSLNPDLNYTAIDLSPEMIKLAKRNNPRVDFLVMDCRNILKLDKTFNGIVSGFIIPYLSKTELIQFISDCKQLLQPNGILYLSFLPSEKEKIETQTNSLGQELEVCYYRKEEIVGLLKNSSFSIIQSVEKQYLRSDQTLEEHAIVIAKS